MISVVRLFILGDLVRMGRQKYFLKMTTTIMYPRFKNTTKHIYWYLEGNPQNPNFQTGHGRAFTKNLLSDYLDIIAICRSGTLGLGGYNYIKKKMFLTILVRWTCSILLVTSYLLNSFHCSQTPSLIFSAVMTTEIKIRI